MPEVRIPAVGARIMDLQSPERKMSTTGGSVPGNVYVLDEPEAIAKKFRSSVTDSGSEVRRGPDKAGISNLIEILAAVRDSTPERVEQEFDGQGYGAFKSAVAEAVSELPAAGPGALSEPAGRRGRARARSSPRGPRRRERSARRTLLDVREAMGVGAVRPPG